MVTQDGDHFLFADFVVAVAAFVDGLDDRFELFLRDHGLFSFGFGWGRAHWTAHEARSEKIQNGYPE